MASRSLRKKQCVGSALVDIDFSFQSGAQEDGSFLTPTDAQDGYNIDAYGAYLGSSVEQRAGLGKGLHGGGVFGVLRVGVGQYEIILDAPYVACMSKIVSFDLVTEAVRIGCFVPTMENVLGSDGKLRSKVRLKIINGSGDLVDLTSPADRINVSFTMKNGSAV